MDWPLGSRGRIDANVTVIWNVPLMPWYAPFPLPSTIGTGTVVVPSDEHVVGLSGGKFGGRLAALISNEPFESTSRL